MLAIFKGAYVVWGLDREPIVKLLDAHTREFYLSQLYDGNAARAAGAVPMIFGHGYSSAVPADNAELLRLYGEKYEGPQQKLVRAYCAAIVLGIPFEQVRDRLRGPEGGNGGVPVRQPRKPVKPRPGGVAVAVPT